jgi:quercetin dioxygenase-like cupin family protein
MKLLRSQEGQSVQVLGDSVCIKLKAADSPNQMTVVTVDVPPGGCVPPHTHHQDEESYYMLRGTLDIQLGDKVFAIAPGDFIHVPAGTIHSYHNTSNQPSCFLAWAIGGTLDDFFVEMAATIRNLPDDLPKIPEILDRYGIRIVA